MDMDEESDTRCQSEGSSRNEEQIITDRQQLLQESRTDIEIELRNIRPQPECINNCNDLEEEVICPEEIKVENETESEEAMVPTQDAVQLQSYLPLIDRYEPTMNVLDTEDAEQETNVERLERYGTYLERYGPQLERYGEQLERFGSQLERIGPHLERCGSHLERYGPQLEAIGRRLERSGSHPERNVLEVERPWRHIQQNQLNLQTQTESGNEGFGPQSADSCQGTSVNHSERQPTWINTSNPRNLSRRPSFQVNDGLLRRWMRRRNLESRDSIPFNRFREERERRRTSLWRNNGDLREYRRSRGGGGSRSYHDNFSFSAHPPPSAPIDDPGENNQLDGIAQNRSLRPQVLNEQQENGGLIQQNHVRILRRNSFIHQDDPDFGFVLLNNQNAPGPSRPDTSAPPERRPRSRMSLRPLNVFFPPQLGPIAEYGTESEDDNNEHRPDTVRRRNQRRRQGNAVRSWVMMNNYFQPRPIFIGQGDSKAMDGPFTLQHLPTADDHLFDGNERNGVLDNDTNQRLIPRIQRYERRHSRQHLGYQALA